MGDIIITKTQNINNLRQVAHQNFAYGKYDLTADAQRCHVSYYEIPPGKSNYPFHYHMDSEESFYILSGKGTLKTIDGETSVEAGDFIFFPAGEKGAHRLINVSDSTLSYLDFDTACALDVCIYPDSQKIAIRGKGIRQVHRQDSQVDYFDGEM